MRKLGIILAFLVSVVAAGGSYYLYQGWVEERTARSSVEAKYDQVKEKMITVQSEKEQLKAQSEDYRVKAEAKQTQLEQLQSEQSRINSEKADLEKQLQSRQEMITELQAKMGELEQKAKEAQAACGVTPADVAGGGTSSRLSFKPVTPGSSSASVSAVASTKPSGAESLKGASAGKAGATTAVTPASKTSPATVEAVKSPEAAVAAEAIAAPKVLTVNRKFNFVVINQGLQQGLKMGDKLKVLRQGKEIATVQIEKLYDKFSAATLVEENPKKQVVEGDEIRKV